RNSAIGAAAAEVALGENGGRVLATMVVLSAAGILNTICLAPPYVLYAMAQDGCFPAAFGRLHPRWHTPVLGILGQGIWSTVLLLLVHFGAAPFYAVTTIDTLGYVCDGVVYADWLFFTLCGIGLLVLRRRAATARHPFGGWVAIAFALGAAAVTIGAVFARPLPSLVGTGLVLLGLVAQWWLDVRVKNS
ncbi:MAG: APC family permease, partial [Planctomycetes bacterium]|nr:APC family permease [Planctomycetota bacterium]